MMLPSRQLRVELDGAPLPPDLAARVTLVLLRQALGVPAAAEIDLAQPGEAASAMRPGQGLALRFAGGEEAALFEGEVAAVEQRHDARGGHVLRLRAYDALYRARLRRRSRALADASAASLAREIAADLGLGLLVREEPPARPLVLQRGESDLDLLLALATSAGVYPVLRDGSLCLLALDGEGVEVPLRLGEGLREVVLRSSSEEALGSVSAQAWDPATLDTLSAEAVTARQDAFDLQGPPGSLPARPLHGRLAGSEAEARAAAQAALDRAAAAAASATGRCAGDPRLTPGRSIRIEGVAAGAGRYVVTEAVHRFCVEGYVTSFSTLPPAPRPAPRPPLLTLGVVAGTDDPEGMGRCRVTLPAFDGLQTGWMQLLLPGAGAGKGIAALPETGDQVLVAFPDGDAASGIVLGGLWGRQRLPRGLAAKPGAPRAFVLRTPEGHAVLELGGATGLARLSTVTGNLVELAPGRLRIAAAGDLVIEAPGRTLTLRAEAIRMEQG